MKIRKTKWAKSLKSREAGHGISSQGTLASVWNSGRTTVTVRRSFCRPGETGQARTEGRGYTIIEVMIVLAISGLMFVLAAVFISGKQDDVAFSQGMAAAGSLMTDTINSVANGEFPPLPDNRTCTNGNVSGVAGDNKGQGTSENCVFLGKVMEFNTHDSNSYTLTTVTGRQFIHPDTLEPVQSFQDARPSAVPGPATDTYERALEFTKAYRCDNKNCTDSTKLDGMGFFGSFGNYNNGQATDKSSGAQSVTVVTLPRGADISDITRADPPNSNGDPSILSGGSYVVMCFKRGDKFGQVRIGGAGGQTTAVKVMAYKDSPCQS